MLVRQWKHWQRGKEILRIVSRHGFSWLLSLDLKGKAAAARFQAAGDSFPKMMESLGPVFVKMGQVLAARPGLFEGPIRDALARIEDRGKARLFSTLQSYLREQLGKAPSALFSSYQDEPVVCSSTGWVYRATLKDGRGVVLKLRRPGVEQLVELDLDLLLRTVRFAERHTSWMAGLPAREILEEVRQRLKQDLNLVEEGRNCERLKKNLYSFPQIRIPAVLWEYSSPDLLTLEAFDGVKLSSLEAFSGAPVSLARLGESLASLYLKQILVDGFFHTRPSPEELALDGEGRILLGDYKAFGSLSPAGMELLKGLISAIHGGEVEKFGALLSDSRRGSSEDGRAFSLKLRCLLNREGVSADQTPAWDEIFPSVIHMGKEMNHSLPQEVLAAGRTLALLDKTIRCVSPEVHLLALAACACGL